jgi:multiple sugar transport system ATP-binding protein
VASLSLKGVSKTYPNGRPAVRDLTLDIEDGELLVLVGPSGSGKSTVLRLIAGLETPSSGQVVIDGRNVTGVAPQDRDLAMVFQNYALYPHKSVRENLAFGLRVRRVAPAEIEARVQATAALLDIDTLLDRKPGQLSGGQQQRVALGRAIVRNPNAFLLDEPLSNLDPLLRAATRAELALLHRRLAATMVYVTHDQEEAMTLGTRVAVFRDGILEQLAPPLDVFRRPANTFVAGFIGSPAMNMWLCTPSVGEGATRLAAPAFTVDIDREIGLPTDGGQVILGVRPQDVAMIADGEADVSGRVEIAEALGTLTVLHLRVEALEHGLVRAVAPEDTRIEIGDRVGLRLRRDRLHFFEEGTGTRLL